VSEKKKTNDMFFNINTHTNTSLSLPRL